MSDLRASEPTLARLCYWIPKECRGAIAVSDTGMGIPQEALKDIFEEFQQVKGSNQKQKGTGLGLAITRRFSELMGGSIRVESELGKGSTFTVEIPLIYKEFE